MHCVTPRVYTLTFTSCKRYSTNLIFSYFSWNSHMKCFITVIYKFSFAFTIYSNKGFISNSKISNTATWTELIYYIYRCEFSALKDPWFFRRYPYDYFHKFVLQHWHKVWEVISSIYYQLPHVIHFYLIMH